MNKNYQLVICFITLLIFLYSDVNGTIRYVSKTGNSTPPYLTWETASDSIQKCINISQNTDTIIVANGEYKETLLLDRELFLFGSSSDSCIINMTGLNGILEPSIGIDVRQRSVVDNFHIIGYSISPGRHAVGFYSGDQSEIKNCRIENSLAGISSIGPGIKIKNVFIINTVIGINLGVFDYEKIWIAENNLIVGNVQFSGNCSGIKTAGGGNLIATNNIIVGKSYGSGIYLTDYRSAFLSNNLIAGYQQYNAALFGPLDSIVAVNNIFLQNKGIPNYSIGVSTTSSNKLNFKNNIIYDNRVGIYESRNELTYTDYNLFWNNGINTQGNIVLGPNTIFADPMFVKDTTAFSLTGDFHLQAYSPAIDAGDPDILDIDGTRSDIGLFGGPLGERYTYQDLSPRPPRNLTASADTGKITLQWLMNTEADFMEYIIYRDTTANFTIDTTKIIGRTGSVVFYNYPPYTSGQYYYKITAVDSQYNQSAPSNEVYVIVNSIDEAYAAEEYYLNQNYPNPFNPSTIISYKLKERGKVQLKVYDIKGELLKVLINEEQEAGFYEAEFNGTGLSSGIYLYRIEVIGEGNIPRFFDMKKLVYLK